MSDRVSETILLCEDAHHERLVKSFAKRCGLRTFAPNFISKVASRLVQGGTVNTVLDRFPEELHACRKRNSRAKTRLIVMIDADLGSVEDRRKQLNDASKRRERTS